MTAERIDAARKRLTTDADRAIFDRAYAESFALPHVPQNVVQEALCLVGLVPSDLEYQQRLYAWDDPRQAHDMALHQSGCGLTREACLDAAGVAGPWSCVSYASRIGTALSAEIASAKKAGAWVDVRAGAAFDPHGGDGVVIGCSSCPGVWGKGGLALEHVLGVLYRDGDLIMSADGGQPAILLRTRRIVEVRGEVWLASVDATMDPHDGRPSKGRRVMGFSDMARWGVARAADPV